MRRVLLLLALAACSSPTGPDQTQQIDEITSAAQSGNVSDYELHIVKNRGADNPYSGAVLSAGTYWVRLERKDHQWDGTRPNSRLSPGVDSIVFVIDGQKTKEKLHPFEAKPVKWSNGSHSVKWTLYGYSKTTQTLTVQVGNNPDPDPDPEPDPEPDPPTPTPTPDPTPDPTPNPTPNPGSYDVVVQAGQSIQNAVDSNPAGTKFLIKSGTHYGQQVTPKNDQKFYGESGTVLNGQGKYFAFGGYGGVGDRVVIQNIEIKNYHPKDADFGAIQGDNTVNWIVRNNNIHNNQGSGIRVGRGMQVLNNNTHDNENLGVAGFKADDVLIEGNIIEGNGYAGKSGSYAGLKIVVGRNIVLRNNKVFGNTGRGLWLDTDIFNALIEDNHVHDNTTEGIWLEIACGATVRNNLAERNGLKGPLQQDWPDRAGIQIVNGTNIKVTGNTLRGNLNAIALLGPQGYPTYQCKPDLRNIQITNNNITASTGSTGAASHWGDPSQFSSITFQNNTYNLGSNTWFVWKSQKVSAAQWRAAGNDTNGTFK